MARNDESRIQAAIVDYVRTCAPQCIVAAVPNGGLRSKREAHLLKWTGVLAGIPDLFVLAPGGRTIFIEVKTDAGRMSPEQTEMRARIEALGFVSVICRSINDARLVLMECGIETREAA